MWKWIRSVALVAALVIGAPADAAVTSSGTQHANQAREVADLQAQQKSAKWTKAAAIASFMGVGVSAIGLIAIWRQLRHSASALREASRSSKAAADAARAAMLGSRPWLKIVSGSAQYHQDEDPPLLTVSLLIANVGATPAVMAVSHIAHIAEARQALVQQAIRDLEEGDLSKGTTVFPGEEFRTTHALRLPGATTSQVWIVAVLVSYRMAGSGENHTSGTVLSIRADTDDWPHTGEQGEVIWDTFVHIERSVRVDAT